MASIAAKPTSDLERAARVTGAVTFACEDLHTLVLVNGSAMIGAMTFVGHIWSGSAASGAPRLHPHGGVPHRQIVAGVRTEF